MRTSDSILNGVRKLLKSVPVEKRSRARRYQRLLKRLLRSNDSVVEGLRRENEALREENEGLKKRAVAALDELTGETEAPSSHEQEVEVLSVGPEAQVLAVAPLGVAGFAWSRHPLAHARDILQSYQLQEVNELGWLEPRCLAPGHANGYFRVNLRNTRSQDPDRSGQRIGASPGLHQLALTAVGRTEELKLTPKALTAHPWQVSHLCHNGACVNASHLVVEPGADNKARNECHGSVAIGFQDFSFHPCPHGRLTMQRRCLLPQRRFTEPGAYHN